MFNYSKLLEIINNNQLKNTSTKYINDCLVELKKNVGIRCERYKNFAQEDAVDFYKTFINMLIDDYKKFANIKSNKNEDEILLSKDDYNIKKFELIKINQENLDIISSLYVGKFMLEYYCIKCNYSLISVENFIDIILHTGNNDDKLIDVESLLNEYFREEVYDDLLPCSNCNEEGVATCKKSIIKLPKITTLTLDRCIYNCQKKDNRKVKEVQTINIGNNYDVHLFSTMNHFGGLNSGHYIK